MACPWWTHAPGASLATSPPDQNFRWWATLVLLPAKSCRIGQETPIMDRDLCSSGSQQRYGLGEVITALNLWCARTAAYCCDGEANRIATLIILPCIKHHSPEL